MRKLIDMLEREDVYILGRIESFAHGALVENLDSWQAVRNLLYVVQRAVIIVR
jgi:hypothetical protein